MALGHKMKQSGIVRPIVSGLAFIVLIIVLPVLLLVAVPVALVLKILGIGQKCDRSAEEVATYICSFIENTDDDYDWDDFTSVTITNPKLEAIRKQAADIPLPMNIEGLGKLKELLKQAEALQGGAAIKTTEACNCQ